MARAFLKVFFDFEERTEKLSETERGRLLVGMLHYAKTGEEPELTGNEQFIWPVFKGEIDKEIQSYETKVANGSKGGRPSKETEGNRNKPNETEKKRNAQEQEQEQEQEYEQEQEQEQEQEEGENEDDDDDIRARAREAAVRRSFLRDFGRNGTPEEVRQICWAAAVHGFGAEMAAHAVQRAAQFNAKSPVRYVKEIFDEWSRAGCETVDDVGRYQFEEDNRTGRNTLFGAIRSWKDGHAAAEV